MSDTDPQNLPREDSSAESVPQEAPAAAASKPPTPEKESEGGMLRWILETVFMVVVAVLLAQGIKAFIVQPFVIPTGSMETTIMIGDRVLAEKITYHFREPEPGDVIVFNDPTARHPQLIKRIIAVGGQEIDIRDDHVYVDGELLDEPYVHGLPTTPGTEPIPLTVPDGYVWVMGDNRPNSGDSRFIGPQPVSAVLGRAFTIYWPIEHWSGL